MERPYENYIGVFDSGVGGISVLKECASLLPHEDFLFYGDSAHNPYGDKTPEEVLSLSMAAMEEMIHGGVKALVIACNTATSIAGKELRAKYETETFPVIGIEPAVKPAALDDSGSRILVMATANTLSQDKYYHLIEHWGSDQTIIPLPCVGLAQRIEQGNLDGEDLMELLDHLLSPYMGKVDSIVLGCTHKKKKKKQISQIMGADIPLFDGGAGTARELKRRLGVAGLLSDSREAGHIVFRSSVNTEEELRLYQWMFEQPIET